MPKKKCLVVPYSSAFKVGSSGPDRKAVKRALRHAGDLRRKGELDDQFGVTAAAALRKFQHRNEIHKGVGTYTRPTHTALVAHRHFDAYGASLMAHAKKRTAKDTKRSIAVATAMLAYHHAPRHYINTDSRRCQAYYDKIRPPEMWDYEDCSGLVLYCYWIAGVIGCGPYDGYTGTMVVNGRRVSIEQAKPGDAVIYGSSVSDTHHTAILVSKTMVVSHGSEGGPRLLHWRYRTDIVGIYNYID